MLRSVDYRDADRIVTLLTRERGVVSVLGRGARKASKRFPGGVPAMSALEAEIALGRGEVGRLAEAHPRRSFPGVLAALGRIEAAGAALELLRRLLPPRQPEPEVYDDAVALLAHLEAADPDTARALAIAFRARAAALVGLEPSLERCGGCGRPPPPGRAALFAPAAGAIVCRACGGGPLRLDEDARVGWSRAAGEGWAHAFGPSPAAGAVGQVDAACAAFLDWQIGRRRKG